MQTITQAATELGVTPRALRHYERLGLVTPTRDGGNGYRVYSETDLAVLRIVVVLRRLGVPLDAIGGVLADPSDRRIRATLRAAAEAAGARARAGRVGYDVLTAILGSLDAVGGDAERPGALPAGLGGLCAAIDAAVAGPHAPELPAAVGLRAEVVLPDGETTMTDIEGDTVMTDVERDITGTDSEPGLPPDGPAAPPGGRLTDVRIVHLPRATVAAGHVIGPEPETRAWEALAAFIADVDLLEREPGARLFGFNHPNPTEPGVPYGYEMWVTVSEDLEIPVPLRRAAMTGGTYAAHAITMGDFHEWGWLEHWLTTSTEWEFAGDPDDAEHMFGSLEEQLNLPGWLAGDGGPGASAQLDLLMPVRAAS